MFYIVASVFIIAIIGFCVYLFQEGRKAGLVQGRDEVWKKFWHTIKSPNGLFEIDFVNHMGGKVVQLYKIKPYPHIADRLHQPHSLKFSKANEEGLNISIISKQGVCVYSLKAPVDSIPKSLHGVEISCTGHSEE